MDYSQNSLFNTARPAPLADRMRPETINEYAGQEHLLGKGKLLRQQIESDSVNSMILWGPPGVGKTTLAMIIAKATSAEFINFSAVTSGIKEIREVMLQAKQNKFLGLNTVLFVDEIHRFNKAQQDAFLPHVESGNIILIGATTENPSFEINSALLSRCRVFVLNPLSLEDIVNLLKRALTDSKGYGNKNIKCTDEVLTLIANFSNGDARSAYNILEAAVSTGEETITSETVSECIQKKTLLYDKNGEEHYNLISALHKSMRNSDPDAAVYYLARMLEGGEDPLYVARRLVRFASEDIGMADPKALELVVASYNACHYIGMPECTVNLTQAVVYLSLAPKSNSLYSAYEKAKIDAQATMAEAVPLHLRNAPTKLMENLGYGKNYKYAHDFKESVTNMVCLPANLVGRKYYIPTQNGFEKNIKERMDTINKLKSKKEP